MLIAVIGIAVLLLALLFVNLSGGKKTVGKNLSPEKITEFYYTLSSSTNPPSYRRYHFYREGEQYFFFHERREGDHWPLTEKDAVISETLELSSARWAEFLELLQGGTVVKRSNSADAGRKGPWLYLYWEGDKGKYQEFHFPSQAELTAFLSLCQELANHP